MILKFEQETAIHLGMALIDHCLFLVNNATCK